MNEFPAECFSGAGIVLVDFRRTCDGLVFQAHESRQAKRAIFEECIEEYTALSDLKRLAILFR